MRRLLPLLTCIATATTLAAPDAGTAQTPETPLPALPYTRGLEPGFMDRAADPCEDFYQYACGGWQKQNPIPADQSAWSVYGKSSNEIQRHLWALLAEAAKAGAKQGAMEKQVGDYFAACMDEAAIDARGAKPLEALLTPLAAVKDKTGLAKWLAQAHLALSDSGLLFGFGSEQDASDSSQFIPAVYAGGLGLPDRDDYLDKDAKSVEIRARYLGHVQRMLELLGDDAASAQAQAAKILRLETELAKASLTRVERRDPYKVFHRMDLPKLAKLAPAFDWATFFADMAVTRTGALNASQPKFLQRLSALLAKEPLEDVKLYLRWHVLNVSAESLSRPFVEADFAFYSKFLRGAEALAPRWKRCVQYADRDLGHSLGQLFVRKNFSPELKERTLKMVEEIQAEMAEDLKSISWMSPATKKQGLAKLQTMANKIGYPEVWRDYGSVAVTREDFAANVRHATEFEVKRQLAKIGKPLDRKEWLANAQEVNAYYDAQMNDINFPAGVLQPPLFDGKMDDAPNYGNTGGTVGHELTHGFDDEGRLFDAAGNLRDWWTQKDGAEFKRRAKCVSDQFSSYIAIDDIHVKGELTLGEDVADLGGLILAYRAWRTHTANQRLMPVDGLTPDQRFFVGYAQWACANIRPEAARLRARTDPHSPPKYRVNGLVPNIPEFGTAFSCKPGSAMTKPPEKVCKIW